jgi:hypothetical protein
VDIGDVVDAPVVDVGDGEVVVVPVVDPEPVVDDDELTGIIVPATDIDDTGNCETGSGVGVGVLSEFGPRAVEVGTVGDGVAVVPCPMADRMPATLVGAVAVDPAVVEDGVVVSVVPDDDPADDVPVPEVVRLLDAPAPEVVRLLDAPVPDVVRLLSATATALGWASAAWVRSPCS